MRILITNDDGYKARGIKTLTEILKPYGEILVIAPKYAQSGMGMAINLRREPVGYRDLGIVDGVRQIYFNGTPAACVKLGVNHLYFNPDIVVSGINHGTNACAAMLYSGTLGATAEAAVNGIPAIGVSLNDFSEDADFSVVREHFPAIFEKLAASLQLDENASPCYRTHGIYYNVNFPACAPSELKGVKIAEQGRGRWIKEWDPFDKEGFLKEQSEELSPEMQAALDALEEGEQAVVIGGTYEDDPQNPPLADHHQVMRGYVSIVPHKLNNTDYQEMARLQKIFE